MENIEALNKRKIFAARFSIISNSALLVLKFLVGFLTASVSIIAEAIHSGIDLIAAIIANISVIKSSQPADEKHRFGHGKIENISALIEGALIFFAAYLILHEVYDKLMHGIELRRLNIGILVMLISTVSNYFISKYLFRTAKETESAALNADAWHLRTDVITSLGVFIGLFLINTVNTPWIKYLDPAIAALTAILIIKAAWSICKEAILNLIDESVSQNEEALIKKAIAENADKYVGFHKLRTRRAGPFKYVDLHLVVSRELHVDKAHSLTHHFIADIKKLLPNTDVMIHVEPCNNDCDNCKLTCSKH